MNFLEKIEKVISFDNIRFFKLMEISQYAIFGLMFVLYTGSNINNLFPKFDAKKETYVIIVEVIIQLIILIIITYYIKKIILIFPFFLSPIIHMYNLKYISSKKNESLTGTLIGVAYADFVTQTNITNKISELSKRFSLNK